MDVFVVTSSCGCSGYWSALSVIFLQLTVFDRFDLIVEESAWGSGIFSLLQRPCWLVNFPLRFRDLIMQRCSFVSHPLQMRMALRFKHVYILNSLLKLRPLPLLLQKSNTLHAHIHRVPQVRSTDQRRRRPLKLVHLASVFPRSLLRNISSLHNRCLGVVLVFTNISLSI